MDNFNYVGCFFFALVCDKNNSMHLTNMAMGVEKKHGDDLKHLGTVAGERKKILLPLILNLEFKIVGVFLQMQLKDSKITLNIKLCLSH